MKVTNGAKIFNHTLKHSVTLCDNNVITLTLKENMRVKKEMDKSPNKKELQQELVEYEQWLLKLREGNLHSKGVFDDYHSEIFEIPNNMCCDTEDSVIEAVFDDSELNIGNTD